MPLRHTDKGWFWGSQGPFASKDKALAVARAAYASGYKENEMEPMETSEFVATLLHSATVTHLMHFKTDSYAEHMALGQYYEGIVDLVDSLAESIQGRYGVIPVCTTPMVTPDVDAMDYMNKLRVYVELGRSGIPNDSEIQNEVDNVANLINTTIDRLRRS